MIKEKVSVVVTMPWMGVQEPSANSIELEYEVGVKKDIIPRFPVI